MCGMYGPALESNSWLPVYQRFLSFTILYGNISFTQNLVWYPIVTNSASASPPPVPRHFQAVLQNLLPEFCLGFYKYTSSWNAIRMDSAPGPLVLRRRPAMPVTSVKPGTSKLSGVNFSYLPPKRKPSSVCTHPLFLSSSTKGKVSPVPRSASSPDLDIAPYLLRYISPSFTNSPVFLICFCTGCRHIQISPTA